MVNYLGINKFLKMSRLSKYHLDFLVFVLQTYFLLENELIYRKEINVKKTIDNGSYRGLRCIQRLPRHGQRTRANAETNKKIRIKEEPLSKRRRRMLKK
jgi:ribosomal protein S13